MTTCFPTEMFNQRLVGWGADTFSSTDLIFHFPFFSVLESHIYQSAVRRRREEAELSSVSVQVYHLNIFVVRP